jgi:hypothetical protein
MVLCLNSLFRMLITFLVYSAHGTFGLTSYKTFEIWYSWELWLNLFTKENLASGSCDQSMAEDN